MGFSKLDMSNVDMSKEAANEVKLSMQRIIREHMNLTSRQISKNRLFKILWLSANFARIAIVLGVLAAAAILRRSDTEARCGCG